MRSSLRFGAGLGALLLCMGADARACDVTGWLVTDNEGPCLSVDSRSDSSYAITNECDEPVRLTRSACIENCPPVLELEPGETGTLALPSPAQQDQTAEFRYLLRGEAFTLRFGYQLNECDDGSGCNVSSRRDTRPAAQGLALFALGFALRFRRARQSQREVVSRLGRSALRPRGFFCRQGAK
jgi:hypothetical protein